MHVVYGLVWVGTRLFSKSCRATRTGVENIPKSGGFILASNHISYYDPPLIGAYCPREIFFFAKEELFVNPFLRFVMMRCNARPVRRGAVDRQSLRTAIGQIKAGYGLTLFPEGTRSKTDDFLPPKAGIGMIARKAVCPIIPVYLSGANRIGDCLRFRDRIRINFGEPISAEWVESQEASKEGYLTIAHTVMDRIALLKKETH